MRRGRRQVAQLGQSHEKLWLAHFSAPMVGSLMRWRWNSCYTSTGAEVPHATAMSARPHRACEHPDLM